MDIRPLDIEDISWCQQVFDASYYDLHRRYGLIDREPDEPDEWLRPILTHFLSTDPRGSLGVSVDGRPVAFAASFQRDEYWFLSFLFVHPSAQREGLGRRLLNELVPTDPSIVRATVVESFQPASTGLYASFGVVPQAIKYWLSGVSRPDTLPSMPEDLHRSPLSEGDAIEIDALDRTVLGFTRSRDHGWRRREMARGWTYRRGEKLVAYVYIEDDYVGPALAADESTLREVVADVVKTAPNPASISVNLSSNSGQVFRMLIDAGARIDDSARFQFLYCSDQGPLPSCYIHNSDWLP